VTSLANTLSFVATAVASVAVARAGSDYVWQFFSARAEARKLAKELEAAALQSNDITMLGRYLYDNIGATRVSNYVNDKVVRERVQQALAGVLAFLGPEENEITPEEAVEAEEAAGQRSQEHEGYGTEVGLADEPMRIALEDIRVGEVWNGLARMRRYLETRLRAIAPADINMDRLGLGQLLNILTNLGIVPESVNAQLRYPIRVANAGIHGNDIDRGQAEEAWRMAASALAELASSVSPDADPSQK
jgi:hypothetical protein